MKERINGCKVELKRCELTELYAMAENLSESVLSYEDQLNRVLAEIGERTGLIFMGEITDTVEPVEAAV